MFGPDGTRGSREHGPRRRLMAIETVNRREAKAPLSQRVEPAAKGKPFVTAEAGKPIVKVVPLDDPARVAARRFGGLEGQFEVPDDFDTLGQDEIEKLFCGDE